MKEVVSLLLADLEKIERDCARSNSASQLLDLFFRRITRSSVVARADMCVFDETLQRFHWARGYGEASAPGLSDPQKDRVCLRYLQGSAGYRSEVQLRSYQELPPKAGRQLRNLGATYVLSIAAGRGVLVLLFLCPQEKQPVLSQRRAQWILAWGKVVHQQLEKWLLFEDIELAGDVPRGIAHDLQNLMVPLTTFIQLCQSGGAGMAAQREWLDLCQTHIRAIEAYTRRASGNFPGGLARLETRCLTEIVKQSIELEQRRLREKGLKLSFNAPTKTPLRIDAILIQRLVSNLLANTIEASPAAGGVQIDILPWEENGDRAAGWKLVVCDEGSGLGEWHSSLPFMPELVSRRGMGLFICRKIVALHQGRLSWASRRPRGTRVEVCLPQLGRERDEPAKSEAPLSGLHPTK